MSDFCNTLEGIAKSCSGNTGGIVKMWLNNGHIYDTYTVDAEEVVTDVTELTGATDWVEFSFNPNTSNYTENASVDLVNGTNFWTQTITLQLARREASKRRKLLLLANGQPALTAIVKDSNGLFWVFGIDDDKLYLTGDEGGSGTLKGDLNGYTLTFTCEDKTKVREIEESVVNTLTA